MWTLHDELGLKIEDLLRIHNEAKELAKEVDINGR